MWVVVIVGDEHGIDGRQIIEAMPAGSRAWGPQNETGLTRSAQTGSSSTFPAARPG